MGKNASDHMEGYLEFIRNCILGKQGIDFGNDQSTMVEYLGCDKMEIHLWFFGGEEITARFSFNYS